MRRDWCAAGLRSPGRPQIRLGFARLRASDRRHRVGSLIVNPGGPGGAGSEVVAAEAAGLHLWHPALHRRFDLIGMDPRGIGLSTPVRCDPAIYNRIVSFAPRSRAQFRRLDARLRALGRSCLRRTGPLLEHVDTVSVARDMERLRRALGDGKLNFLGLSYGAEIGVLYAARYPKRIRTMALDGVFDHGLPMTTIFSDNARGYEDSLTRFAAWCAADASCALHGRDVLALYDQLVRAPTGDRSPPRSARTGRAGEPSAGATSSWAPTTCCCSSSRCRRSASQVGTAWRRRSRRPRAVTRAPSPPPWRPARAKTRSPAWRCCAPSFLVRARLRATSPPWACSGASSRPTARASPRRGPGVLGCQHWPVPPANPPQRVNIHRAPPILLVSATHDPSTPYVWAQDVRSQIARSVLLTRDGDGHTSSLLSGSRTRDTIANYLITKTSATQHRAPQLSRPTPVPVPTSLRTDQGLIALAGERDKPCEFTPVRRYGNAGLSARRFGLREKDACDVDGEPRQQRADEPVAVANGLLAAVRSHRRDRGGLRIGKPQLAGARREVHVPLGAEVVYAGGRREHFDDKVGDDVERALGERRPPCGRPPGEVGRKVVLAGKADKDVLQEQARVAGGLLPAAHREEELALRGCRLPAGRRRHDRLAADELDGRPPARRRLQRQVLGAVKTGMRNGGHRDDAIRLRRQDPAAPLIRSGQRGCPRRSS